MKIAQVAPLYESVPPRLYGNAERVVSYLTEELVAQGHDVSLFASGDSVTQAGLVSPSPQALRLDQACVDQLAHHILMLEQVFQTGGRVRRYSFSRRFLALSSVKKAFAFEQRDNASWTP
jgi:hypothetical protein